MKTSDEIKYLSMVADYFRSLGYEVEDPKPNHTDLLDVWGKVGRRKCFQEIYVTMYECHGGINGVWYQGDNESVEVFLNENGSLYGASDLVCIIDGLNPIKKVV